MTAYKPGTEVAVRFTITDAAGALYDPAGVRFHYTVPDGTDVTRVYNTDTEVTRVSAGVYQCVIAIPYAASSYGRWHYDAQALDSSGVSKRVESHYFDVTRLKTLE